MLLDELKRPFPQVHVSRGLSRKVHMCASSVDVVIVHRIAPNVLLTESEEKDRQMNDHAQDVDIPLTRFEQSLGGHVPVGDDRDDGDDDDDAFSLPRSVFLVILIALFRTW